MVKDLQWIIEGVWSLGGCMGLIRCLYDMCGICDKADHKLTNSA